MNLLKSSILLLLWMMPGMGIAQLSIGLMGGVANYQGDLAQNLTNFGETHATFGGGVGYRLSPKIDLKGQILYANLSGDDANYPDRTNRGFKFESRVTEVAAMLEYYILGSSERSNTGIFEPSFTPLVFAGLGVSKIANTATCYSDECKNNPSTNPFPEEDFKSLLFTLPFGVGVKYDASPRMAVGLRASYRYSFSDYLDGISQAGNSNKNDWFFIIGANVTFYLLAEKDII